MLYLAVKLQQVPRHVSHRILNVSLPCEIQKIKNNNTLDVFDTI